MSATTIYRATVFHTPRDAFALPPEEALEVHEDGGLVVEDGSIVALADFGVVRGRFAAAEVVDLRPGYLLPGLVDTHVHYPQVYSVGGMGLPLLAWLERYILPDELRFEDLEYARVAAEDFLSALIRGGTTTALAFGVHVPGAQRELFEAALRRNYRLVSGMVTSDRNLLPAMHTHAERAQRESAKLIGAYHQCGKLRYALTPRFSVSASQRLLASLGELLEQWPDLYVQTHLNENDDEIALVRRLFPEAEDYLGTYEAHGLLGERSVFAHNVHPTPSELSRLAASRSAVAHCPSSNAFLGSGLFPLRAHVERGVRVGLGSDVGAGTGFSLLKEALNAYQAQMLRPDGLPPSPEQLLYLATRAGAEALRLEHVVGDLSPGKAADAVLLRPPEGSHLALLLQHRDGPRDVLGALITLAREESVSRVYIDGREAYRQP